MSDALEGNKASVSNGGRIFKNLRFADDIAIGAEEEEEAVDIVTNGEVQDRDWFKLLFCSACDTHNCHTYIL